MNFLIAGYVLTWAVFLAYAVSLVVRTRQE